MQNLFQRSLLLAQHGRVHMIVHSCLVLRQGSQLCDWLAVASSPWRAPSIATVIHWHGLDVLTHVTFALQKDKKQPNQRQRWLRSSHRCAAMLCQTTRLDWTSMSNYALALVQVDISILGLSMWSILIAVMQWNLKLKALWWTKIWLIGGLTPKSQMVCNCHWVSGKNTQTFFRHNQNMRTDDNSCGQRSFIWMVFLHCTRGLGRGSHLWLSLQLHSLFGLL